MLRISGTLSHKGGGEERNWEAHMKNILGTGEHRYRVVENWAKLPDGW